MPVRSGDTFKSVTNRRAFLKESAGLVFSVPLAAQAAGADAPWHRKALRWGQTNITEKDPEQYDIAWWRQYWKRTRVQGVIINAGGIVAYYPSKYDLQYRAQFLNGRDLYGDLAKAAHEDGLYVLARMDSNRASEDFYRRYRQWFALDVQGKPYRAADKYITCVNSGYYEEWIPNILREIIERSHPEGLTDNSWAGLGRERICYCPNCERRFRDRTSKALPRRKDWDDPVYREWIRWNYDRRVEIWELNNRTTKAAGGAHCLWIGMNSGSVSEMARSFRDMKAISERAEILLLDHQSRSDSTGFQQNADAGKLVHGLLGWDKVATESMALYQAGRTSFRVAAKPAAEARMWMVAGFAGGITPWWHHVGAYHEDRRAYRTAEPVMRWHEANQQYLVNRRPAATVGVLWTQRNTDFYGRDEAEELIDAPWRGVNEALIRARIPSLAVHADHIEREAPNLSLLISPNVAVLTEAQCAAIRRFVERGGGLIASGATSLFDQNGDRRKEFELADVLGVRAAAARIGTKEAPERRSASAHTYLRLLPELRAQVDGPKTGREPAPSGKRHEALAGFEETDILAFGGVLEKLELGPGASAIATYVPPFPVYPPETAWMREPKTDTPAIVINSFGKGRVVYLAADIDRRYSKDHLPDHARLLKNLALWASGGRIPVRVEGPGLVDCHLYRQGNRLILHLVNLTNDTAWRGPIHELLPVGPFRVHVRAASPAVKLLVSKAAVQARSRGEGIEFTVGSISDHEVAVIG